MKRSARVAAGVMAGVLAASSWKFVRSTPAETLSPTATDIYRRGLRRLDSPLVALDAAMSRGDRAASLIAFRDARRDYKRVELFVEYYGSGQVRELNGVTIRRRRTARPRASLH